MPRSPIQVRTAAILMLSTISLGAAGCEDKKVHAAAPVASAPTPAATERPMSVAPDTDATPPPETVAAPPTLPTTATVPTANVTVPPPKPEPARKPAQTSAESESEQPAHPPAPQITPQLSPTDQAAYARKTGEDAAEAEKNLQQISGKQLNAAQTDLIGKIRSFLSQSRDASKDGDWVRAQNLAQKARLLSDELIGSF
jgi:outer membrane biosynthesis protein TonB